MTVKLLIVLTTLAVAEECQQADFEVPQPVGAKNLTEIPRRLRGSYISHDDSTLLDISDKVIVKHDSEEGSISRNELRKDSVKWAEIDHDTIVCEGTYCLAIKPFGDTLKFKMNTIDTLIYISDNGSGGLIRKYRKHYFLNNHYFLNKQKGEMKWAVRMIELNKNELIVSSTYSEKDISFLRTQLKTSDTTLVFNPTRAQFKQFVKEGGFRNQEKFTKQ